ncbi:Bcr/CflA family efflux MFS transporter [Altererythrobacter aurantiacus]|uniref:Bcr/CflA family efflux transporter n=1 Tax=Parapontixanthobacter aurantiacus TaxID=1463599 RepID=A0A844ZID4_9SPHN|nr:multidrug effflux MFS transporter [Parapontixanthobacter aurantiacus]MXO87022.1 Bcr/CflA family efflux MFS transporter [Parapontixanthobacter aurantiacus]
MDTAASISERTAPGERELIVMMAALMSLQAFGIDAMLPALGAMAADFAIDGNSRQLVVAAYLLGSGLGALFPGAFADRFGRRPLLFFGLTFYIGMSLACAFVTSFPLLVGLRAVQGIGCAALTVVPAAIVRDQVGGDRMARLMSLIMMTFLAVPLLAPFVGQAILLVAEWRWIFGAMALQGGAIACWIYLRLPETLGHDNRQAIHVRSILRNMKTAVTTRSAIGYTLGSALIFGSLFGFINSAQQLIGETFGVGDIFPFVFGAMVSGMVFANFVNSRIVEKFGARRVSHLALLLFIIVSGLQLLSSSQADQPLWQFAPLMAVNLGLLGFIGANFSSIAMQPFFHIAGSASSAQTFLRMSTGAILGGAIGQSFDGTARPFAMSLVICAILSLFLVLFSENGRLFRRPNQPVDQA